MENVISGEFVGKTEEEAIEEGLKALSITKEEAEIEVLEEAKKRLFSSTKAKVRITKKKTDGERASEFLEGLFGLLGLDAKISGVSEGEKIIINLETENSNAVIGRRGEILDSVQCLAGAVANIGREEYKRVVVDCQNYRENREETLNKLALKLAAKAVTYGKKIKLEPMNPYERRIIHSALSESQEVKTQSEGKEPGRYVVIIPNNLKPYKKFDKKPYNKNFKNNGKPYGNNKNYNKDGKNFKNKGNANGNRPYNKDKKFDKTRRNYSDSSGTGTGSYVKRDNFKRSSSGFFGTYLGNSKNDENNSNKE